MHALSDGVEAAAHVVDAAVHVADAAAHVVEAAVDVVDAVVDTVVDAVSDDHPSADPTISNCEVSIEEYSETDGSGYVIICVRFDVKHPALMTFGSVDQDSLDEYADTPRVVKEIVEVEYVEVSSNGSVVG